MKNLNLGILNHAIVGMENISPDATQGADLHHELFNTDYFIVGYYEAVKFLESTQEGIFGAIELIKEYEQDNFGQVRTDLSSSEKVANMFAYIKGEELISECKTLQNKWDKKLTKTDIKKIVKELQALNK